MNSKKNNSIYTNGYKPQVTVARPVTQPSSAPSNGYRPTTSSGSSPAQRPMPPKEE